MSPRTWRATVCDVGSEDLMTRRQVAYLFNVTSGQVAAWERAGKLARVCDGPVRYRRVQVEALFRELRPWAADAVGVGVKRF